VHDLLGMSQFNSCHKRAVTGTFTTVLHSMCNLCILLYQHNNTDMLWRNAAQLASHISMHNDYKSHSTVSVTLNVSIPGIIIELIHSRQQEL